MTAPVDRAAKLFTERYGEPPAGVWVAPGRVNLIGEHTDYNDGYVLPFALPHLTAVAAGPASGDSAVCSESFDRSTTFDAATVAPGDLDGWAAYVAGVAWAVREAGSDVPAVRLAVASDVPVGAGVSSSAALECATMAALCDLGSLDRPPFDRVRLAQRAENAFVGVPSGVMDQAAATLCRAGYALFLDCRSLDIEHIPFDLTASGLAILVVNTNAPHRLVDGEYANRRRTCEEAASALGVAALRDVPFSDLPSALARLNSEVARRRVRHVVTEDQRVLDTVDRLRAGDLAAIGPLLTASHASMRDDFEITVPEVDTAVETALSAGAYGARMTGGGFGGCVLALIDADRAEAVTTAVAGAFATAGFSAPDAFLVTAGDGARRAS